MDALQDFLDSAGLASKAPQLRSEGIDGDLVGSLTEDDLRELGFNLGERKRFFAAVEAERDRRETPPTPPERRQLTVAFIDLVGSTNLASGLDPEDFRYLISKYLDAATVATKKHGGYVAYVQGDGVMAFFGFPTAREDDAEWAVRAGLEAIANVRALDVGVREGIEVRVGIATGTVVMGGVSGEFSATRDFAVGETLNFAARLQALAEPSELVVSDGTRSLVGDRFKFESRGTVKLKGFEEPKGVYRVLREVESVSRFEAHLGRGVHPMVGRDREQNRLLDMLRDAGEGRGRLALISAPAGFGKSRLVRSIRDVRNTTVIEWQCVSHLADRSLHPVTNEIQRAAGFGRSDDPEERLKKLARFVEQTPGLESGDLARLADLLELPGNGELTEDPVTRLQRLMELLLRRLRGASSAGAPLILTLEDAHWADITTLEFLEQVASSLDGFPALIVVTFRPHFEPSEALSGHGQMVELVPLDLDASRRLIRFVSGDTQLPSGIERWIVDKTDGVPLFVEELTKTIIRTAPDLSPTATSDVLEAMEIPTTLRDSLMSRLDGTGPAKEAAQLGAVIGREFTSAMLKAIARTGLNVDSALERLVEAELLLFLETDGGEQFQFNHALVQDSAYESILKAARQDIHRILARAMLNGHSAFGVQPAETIARHCDLGGLPAEAVENWYKAGEQALRRASNLPAVHHLRAALRRLEDLPENAERNRIELGIQMALMPACMAIFGWGSPDVENASFRARDLAHDLGEPEALFGASWGIWTLYFLRGELIDALEAAQAVDAMASGAGAPMLLTASDHAIGYTQFYRGEIREALERYELAVTRYDAEAETAIIQTFQLSSSLCIREYGAASLWLLDREEESRTAFEDARRFAFEIDHLPSLAYGMGAMGHTLTLQEDWEKLGEIAEQNKVLSADEGFILWEYVADIQLALALGHGGNVAAGVAGMRKARENFLTTGTRLTDILYHPAFCDLLIRNGEAEEARERLDSIILEAKTRYETLNLSELYRTRGAAFMALGEREMAVADVDRAYQIGKDQGAVPFMQRAENLLSELTNRA